MSTTLIVRVISTRALLAVSTLLLLQSPSTAHELTEGVGTQCIFELFKDRVKLGVNFGVSKPAGFETLFGIDTDFSGSVTRAEETVFLENTGNYLAEKLELYINGHRMRLQIKSKEGSGVVGEVSMVPLDTWFEMECSLPPPLPEGGWWFYFNDESYRDVLSAQRLQIPWHQQGEGISYVVFAPDETQWKEEPGWSIADNRQLRLFFDTQPRPKMVPGLAQPPELEALRKQFNIEAGSWFPAEPPAVIADSNDPSPSPHSAAQSSSTEPAPAPTDAAPETTPEDSVNSSYRRNLLRTIFPGALVVGTLFLLIRRKRKPQE